MHGSQTHSPVPRGAPGAANPHLFPAVGPHPAVVCVARCSCCSCRSWPPWVQVRGREVRRFKNFALRKKLAVAARVVLKPHTRRCKWGKPKPFTRRSVRRALMCLIQAWRKLGRAFERTANLRRIGVPSHSPRSERVHLCFVSFISYCM